MIGEVSKPSNTVTGTRNIDYMCGRTLSAVFGLDRTLNSTQFSVTDFGKASAQLFRFYDPTEETTQVKYINAATTVKPQ